MSIRSFHHARRRAVVALTLATGLALSGCSSQTLKPDDAAGAGNAATSDQTYEFTGNTPTRVQKLTLQIPQGLKKAMGSEADKLLIGSFTLTSRQLEGAKYCAADVLINYASDGATVLSKGIIPSWTSAEGQAAALKVVQDEATRFMSFGEKYWVDKFGPIHLGGFQAIDNFRRYQATESFIGSLIPGQYPTYQALVDDIVAKSKPSIAKLAADAIAKANAVPRWEALSKAATAATGKAANTFSQSDPQPGAYVADDGKAMIVVTVCAAAPGAPDGAVALQFPLLAKDKTTALATAYVTVMKDGGLTVRNIELAGYHTDTTGNWIAK